MTKCKQLTLFHMGGGGFCPPTVLGRHNCCSERSGSRDVYKGRVAGILPSCETTLTRLIKWGINWNIIVLKMCLRLHYYYPLMWIIHRNYFLKDYQVEKVLWWEGAIESRRVTAKLKGLNKTLLSFHCICHRLALPCANASDDVSFIKDVEATLNYLWKFFENSSKKTAAYIQTQENLREINLSKKGRKTVARKMKKVCRTRCVHFTAH